MIQEPFTFWCCSLVDSNAPRTYNNTQDTFVTKLPTLWILQDEWEVYVQSVICSEIPHSSTHKDLLLYSDLIEYVLVGHDNFPLLEWLPPTSDSYVRHQESNHPYIRRVAKSHFDHIGFKIVDTRGRTPKFLRKDPTFIALHFRPAKNNQNKTMDMTLLSNQSKIYFPNNRPNQFTAQLPSLIKMEANEWKVALSKATLPAVSISNVITKDEQKILLSYTPYHSSQFSSTRELEIVLPNSHWESLEKLIEHINDLLKTHLEKKDFVASNGERGNLVTDLCRGIYRDVHLRRISVEKWENGPLKDANWKSHVFPDDHPISLKTFLDKIEELGFKLDWYNPNNPEYKLLTITNLRPGFQRIRDGELMEELGFKPLKHDLISQLAYLTPFFHKKKIVIPFFELKLVWDRNSRKTVLQSELWSDFIGTFSIGFTKGLHNILGFQDQGVLQHRPGGKQSLYQYILCHGKRNVEMLTYRDRTFKMMP